MHHSDCFCSTERKKKQPDTRQLKWQLRTAVPMVSWLLHIGGKELWAETVCTNSLIGQALEANCDPDVTVLWLVRLHYCHIRYNSTSWYNSEHFVNPRQNLHGDSAVWYCDMKHKMFMFRDVEMHQFGNENCNKMIGLHSCSYKI